MKFAHEMIVCIVNTGFSEDVMTAARSCGARGGTILHARGTANGEAESFFKITVQPEKEVVLILVTADIKDAVLHALYRQVGLMTPGQGIAFSMPVDGVVGISKENPQEPVGEAQKETKDAAKEASVEKKSAKAE